MAVWTWLHFVLEDKQPCTLQQLCPALNQWQAKASSSIARQNQALLFCSVKLLFLRSTWSLAYREVKAIQQHTTS